MSYKQLQTDKTFLRGNSVFNLLEKSVTNWANVDGNANYYFLQNEKMNH